ncbi:MAG: hypothetical protein K9N55_08485, partial [Phycisphaerae bacterium]|nr:hypothetical protein [Phycisphaerae bacterium]
MQERVLFFMRGLCLVLASGSLCLSTARAESTNPVIDALHEKLVSHFQGGGYTVSDSGYGRKTLRKSVSEDGGTETVTEIVRRPRTRTTYQKTESGRTVRVNGKPVKITTTTIIETSREYTRSLGSFSSDVKIELSVTPLPDSAERLADMTAQALSQRQKTRLEMERQSATLGTGLNQVAHSHQTQW